MSKAIHIILEIIGWLQITIAALFLSAIPAFIIFLKYDNNIGKTIAVILLIIGFLIGAIWATKILKKYGTISWLSRIRY